MHDDVTMRTKTETSYMFGTKSMYVSASFTFMHED
jgi:hypothetical protein